MDWTIIVGRILGAIPAVAVLVFGIAGHKPEWWEGMIAVVMPFLMWLISKIPPKKA